MEQSYSNNSTRWQMVTSAQLDHACAILVEGNDGRGQPVRVRQHLKHLESAGLATYGLRGWQLTDVGKERVKTHIATCKRCSKKAEKKAAEV